MPGDRLHAIGAAANRGDVASSGSAQAVHGEAFDPELAECLVIAWLRTDADAHRRRPNARRLPSVRQRGDQLGPLLTTGRAQRRRISFLLPTTTIDPSYIRYPASIACGRCSPEGVYLESDNFSQRL